MNASNIHSKSESANLFSFRMYSGQVPKAVNCWLFFSFSLSLILDFGFHNLWSFPVSDVHCNALVKGCECGQDPPTQQLDMLSFFSIPSSSWLRIPELIFVFVVFLLWLFIRLLIAAWSVVIFTTRTQQGQRSRMLFCWIKCTLFAGCECGQVPPT